MLESTDCSTLEEVAAFAEGRLRGAERERLIAHLAGCADCREVLAETIEVGEDLDAEESDQKVADLRPAAVRRPLRSGWAVRVGSVAATVAVVGSSIVAWQLEARKHPPSPSEWLAERPPAMELAPHIWGGVVMRGDDGEAGELTAQSTEIGALLVDFEVALAAHDAEAASDVLNRMATILESAAAMEDDGETLRKAGGMQDIDGIRRALGGQMPALQERLRERFDTFYLDLGTFAGEARIAAAAGDVEFLASRPARRYLAWVLTQREKQLDIAVRDQLVVLQNEADDDDADSAAATAILEFLSH